MPSSSLKGLYVLNAGAFDAIYGESERQDIAERLACAAPAQTAQSVQNDPSILSDVDVIFSGWGMAKMDESLLKSAPRLKAVFYGAGSVKGFVTDAFWERNILLTSAYAANAVPVCEYTLSQILFCLKHGWHYALAIKREGKYPPKTSVPGCYQSTVGIVSLGMIGRGVCEMLKRFDLNVLAYDPFATVQDAKEHAVALCSLNEIFERSDVVSLHTPRLKETEGMITGAHLRSMKAGATFINTSRGAVVRETEMIEVLKERQDLFAVLDVTHPEPPQPGSELYTLPNVVLTPHIAGSMAAECRRMGRYMIEELDRFLRGEPLRWHITREKVARMA